MLTSDQVKPNNGRKVIAVYGSANTPSSSPDYRDAFALGTQLGAAGFDVMTGGYGGTMAATSEGAAQAGGHVIGITVGLFKERGLTPNSFLHEEVHLPTLAERLNYLIIRPDAYVALKGGTGTLSEVTLAWSLLQVGEVPARPLVLVGPMWRDLVPLLPQITTISPNDLRMLTLVDNVDEVVPALEAWWANPPKIPLRLGDVQKTTLADEK